MPVLIPVKKTCIHAEIGIRTNIVPENLIDFFHILFKCQLCQHIGHGTIVLGTVVHAGIDRIHGKTDCLHGKFPAAAGFGNIQRVRKNIFPLHFFSCIGTFYQLGEKTAEPIQVSAAGRQPREIILFLHNAVESGHDHIFRHTNAPFLQNFTHGDRHGVVDADDRLRQTLRISKKAFHDFLCGNAVEIPIAEPLFVKRNAVLFQHVPKNHFPYFRSGIALKTGNAGELGDVVLFDQVLHQIPECISFIKRNADPAGIAFCRFYQKYRFPVFLCRRQNVLHDRTAFQTLGIDQNHIDHRKIHQLKDAGFPAVKCRIPKQICCRIEQQAPPVLFQKRLIQRVYHALCIFVLYF